MPPIAGVTVRISDKLTNEYLEKFLQAPGYLTPYIVERFQWHAAAEAIAMGYRDHEIDFGDTYNRSGRGGRGGFFYYVIQAKVSRRTLAVRRWWRRILPYKWYLGIPYRHIDPERMRWWHFVLPFHRIKSARRPYGSAYPSDEGKPKNFLSGAKDVLLIPAVHNLPGWRCWWMRVPKIEWKEKP